MGNSRATAMIAGPEFHHAPARRRGPAARLPTAPADAEDDVLLFDMAPISVIELPADGGIGPGAPRRTAMDTERRFDALDRTAAARARSERAREVLRAMLRPTEMAAG